MAMLTENAITAEQLLDLPYDGIERWIVNGKLKEWGVQDAGVGNEMTRRNWRHSNLMMLIGAELQAWCDQLEHPGMVVGGEAAIRLRHDPETTVGVDVAYIPPELVPPENSRTLVIEGLPILIVEVLSPSDKTEEIDEKVALYQGVGVPLVWIVSPAHQTITVFEGGKPPVLYNHSQDIAAEPHLPGFRVPLAKFFHRRARRS